MFGVFTYYVKHIKIDDCVNINLHSYVSNTSILHEYFMVILILTVTHHHVGFRKKFVFTNNI